MTPEVQQHLNFARAKLAEAERIFERAELFPATARTAYLAALSAARAIIRHQTGRSPKTHSGTRSEISRLAHIDSRIDGSFAAFLVKGFEVKSDADYGDHFSDEVTRAEAVESLATATRLVAHAEWLLAQPEPPPAP